MAQPITYFVAMPFLPSEDGPVPGEAKEAPSEPAANPHGAPDGDQVRALRRRRFQPGRRHQRGRV